MEFREVGPEFDSSVVDVHLPFTQSTLYFLWNTGYGREGYRFVGTKNGADVFFVQFFVYTIRNVRILYAPLGPIIMASSVIAKDVEAFVSFLSAVISEGGYSFVRMHLPFTVSGLTQPPAFAALSSSFVQPRYDRVLSLSDGGPVLPYGAKRGIAKAKKEVSLEVSSVDDNAVQDFLRLMTETGKRKSLTQHDDDYYTKLLALYSAHTENLDLLFGVCDGERVAMTLTVKSGKKASYLFGGANAVGIQKGAQYFLQWSAMQRAAEAGMEQYSLGGTLKEVRDTDKKNSMYGVSLFKQKFGGTVVSYGDPYDLVVNPLQYWLYVVYKFVRR